VSELLDASQIALYKSYYCIVLYYTKSLACPKRMLSIRMRFMETTS